jgi:hypothetical protein
MMQLSTPQNKDDTVVSSPDTGYLDPCRQRDSQKVIHHRDTNRAG